jgi:hypothetical protein
MINQDTLGSLTFLVLVSDKASIRRFQSIIDKPDKLKFKFATLDSFKGGVKRDQYEAVIGFFPDLDDATFHQNEAFFDFYCQAPVLAWAAKEDNGINTQVQQRFTARFFVLEESSNEIENVIQWCTQRYRDLYENDMLKAFSTYDIDESGTIDHRELKNLLKDLGHALSDEEIDAAMDSLDTNGDGVIDINEFAMWYFSGMKGFGQITKTLLQLKNTKNILMDTISDAAQKILLTEELKVKKSSFSFAFNNPEKPQTKLDVNF